MTEFFIYARSFAAPFFSDTSEKYVEAETPQEALEKFAADYGHPAGLYAAEAWASADDFHKGKPFLAQWLSNHEIAKREATAGLSSYGYFGDGPGEFEISGKKYEIEDPLGGRVVDPAS